MPFWTKFSVDQEYGGYLCGFMRDGELFYEDKSVWQQGRSLWMFSKLYNEFGKKQEWLDAAKSGNYIKGSGWKGPFHNVRAFMLLTQIFEAMERGEKLEI